MMFKRGDLVFSTQNRKKAYTVVDVDENRICLKCTHDRIVGRDGCHTDSDKIVAYESLFEAEWYGSKVLKIIYKPKRKVVVL